MNTHMRIVANLAIAASGLMLQIIGVAPGAVAQELEIQRPEPAQNLWDVRATPGVPQLTFTSPSSSAHAFPTLEGSTTPPEPAPVAAVGQNPVAAVAQNLSDVPATPGVPQLTLSSPSSSVHIFPTLEGSAALRTAVTAAPTPLLYHSGGQIMPTATIYTIFWVPQKLQTGAPTSMSAVYQSLQGRLLTDYPGHGIDNNNTQYYQIIGGAPTWVRNAGHFGGSFYDTSPYPASGCTDSATPGNCITDTQIRAEIQKVMGWNKWTGGIDKIFFLFTSSGEGSCFDNSTSCAYTAYCAYHGFIAGTTPIVYANMPYGNPNVCQTSGTPSPNGDTAADTATTAASHELSEAITDPLLNAWFTAQGFEIGDLCAYQYGANTWDANKANQMWNGNFYELQQEYNNHINACVDVGP
jgi:hypothetical protein